MEIQFLGATQTVTGSKYLLKADRQILIDCGLFQGAKEWRLRNWEKFPAAPAAIDAVVLTHAHLDHTGYLPLLVKNGFRGKIYATKHTVAIAKILLLDSGRLQEEEASRANRLGYSKHQPAKPLYTRDDVELVFKKFCIVDFYRHFNIGKSRLYFKRAGHIFGAAMLLIENEGKTLFFSGDLGRPEAPFLLPPEDSVVADYMVIESTYGDRLHEQSDPEDELGKIINRVAARGGSVIIPAFAVGRAQTLIYYIHQLKRHKKIPDIPVFLDSPMAQQVTNLVLDTFEDSGARKIYTEILGEISYISKLSQSKALDEYNAPRVIISASGMATGGRVLHHIHSLGRDSKNLILFVGHQVTGTRGEKLLSGQREVKIFGEIVQVEAEVATITNMSAHVDYAEMLTWLNTAAPPQKIFVTHGETQAALSLQEKIQQAFDYEVIIPKYLEIEKL